MTTEKIAQNKPVLSVGQLTNAIKHCLETTFPMVWVQGEISNFKKQSSGHLYFSLKDEQAQLSCVMFRGNTSQLKQLPKDGDKVILQGEINVYPPSGKYQIIVRNLQFVGVGELLLRLEELKQEINKRGWFKKEHKKPIPKLPKRIGVVTSPTGAAIQDIINVLTRRFSGFKLLLNPVRVQGVEAAGEIAQAIRDFNAHNMVDVIIVGRGGGSIEDLWAFNEEVVARAIFESQIPIIAAVGHETDHCIAEYVADIRAPTPSAAAEIVIAEREAQLKHLSQLEKRLHHTLSMRLTNSKEKLMGILKQPAFLSPYYLLGPWMQKLDEQRNQLDQQMNYVLKQKNAFLEGRQKLLYSLSPTTKISHCKVRIKQLTDAIDQSIKHRLVQSKKSLSKENRRQQIEQLLTSLIRLKREKLHKVTTTLTAIDPKKLLQKGYSILFSEKSGSVIKSIRQMQIDDQVKVMLADGEALTKVTKVKIK